MNLHLPNLDDDQQRRLGELLKDNPKLRELLSTQESPQDRALRIVSIVRAFDSPMYTDVCRQNDAGLPAFDEIVKNPDVRRVPRAEGQFWLRESVQNYWLSYWEKHTDEYMPWAKLFAEWLDKNDKDPAEQLALLLRFDCQRALQLLKTKFEEANAKDDLSLCHSLTRQVEANLDKISSDLRPRFLEFVARYRGRAWFLQEFHRTIKYFPRKSLETDFQKLVAGDDSKWILYLSSRGGLGKTMFVQRMIAHELLKKPPFPLVARIDLDDIEVSEIARAPWLVAIEIAEELDEQLTRRLFSDGSNNYLGNVRPFSPLLYRRESDRGRTLTDDARAALRGLASGQFSHWSAFISRCMELPRDRPLVVFIDTIEEATLHWPAQFRHLLARFEELRKELPQLRLVLSGRYPPSDETQHFLQYDGKLKGQTRFVRLEPFEPDDAARFIRMQLPDLADQLVNTMVSAATGSPFKLSMLCEIISQNPGMDDKELKEYGADVDVAYLIKRVVERIPVADELGLRWLLRYGAVPRRLTFTFLQEVLHPLLLDALSGKVEAAKEDIPSDKERLAWIRDADTVLDPEHLWQRLSKYASDHSWISLSKDRHTATLHPDVVTPMRRLLKQQPISNQIHRKAVDHIQSLKAQHLDRWVELTLAELYHRVQLGEDRVHEALVAALDERPSPDDADIRLEVLREIVKPDGDFIDATAATLARAHYEIADTIAIEANFDYLPQDTRREDIRRSLEKAFELNRSADIQLPPFAFKWRDFLDRNIPSTPGVLADLFLVRKSDESKIRYWLLIIEMLAQEALSSIVFEPLAALFGVLTGSVSCKRVPAWAVLERRANAYRRRGSLHRAEWQLREILNTWPGPRDGKHFRRIQASLIELLVMNSGLLAAEAEIRKADAAGSEEDQGRLPLRIEICLLRRDAWTALDLTEKIQDKQHYRFHLLRGRALGQLLRIDEAMAAFADAMQAALKSETPTLLDDIRREELMFRLFEAGLPTEPAGPRPTPVGAATELELIRAFQVRDNRAACEAIIQTLISDRHPDSTRIRATIAGVSWGILPSASINDSFISMLDRIGNAGMRLRLLEPPVLLGQVAPWQLSWFKRFSLRTSLTPQSSTGAGMLEWVAFGRALLAMGDGKRADAAFANVKVGMGASKAELAVFRQRGLADLQAPSPTATFWIGRSGPPQAVEFFDGLASEPGLHAAALAENAERAVRASEWTIATRSLGEATTVLQNKSVHPILVERASGVHRALTQAMSPGDQAIESLPSASAPNDSDVTLMDYRCALLALDSRRLSVEAAGQDRLLLSPFENPSLGILCEYSRERSPRRLVPHFIGSWPEPVEELREPLAGLLEQTSDKSEPVLLALTGAPLVAVPWELALPPSHVPVRIGNGRNEGPIVDEIRDPAKLRQTAKFLSGLALQFRSGIGVYRVPYSATSDMVSQMSILDDRLMASGLLAPGDPTAADVIYVMTDIEDSPSLDEPCLPDGMTGERLGREFQRRRADGSRPFVVLHTPTSSSLSHALEQVFARNRLAQALINGGAVSGVLATGVTSSPDDPRPQDLLLESLRTAGHMIDVMRTLRASSVYPPTVADLEKMLSLPATALFLSIDPELL